MITFEGYNYQFLIDQLAMLLTPSLLFSLRTKCLFVFNFLKVPLYLPLSLHALNVLLKDGVALSQEIAVTEE